MKDNKYEPSIVDRWPDDYFNDRHANNKKRLNQFEIDIKFIKKYIKSGNVCDVGCSTGEFLRQLNFSGQLFGMEINEYAKKKASEFINFEKNIFTEENFFDLIIFRGTIQHVDEPFRMIKYSYKSLKKEGFIVFLSTPNTNSILYKLKNNLGFLDKKTNFYIPGEIELCNALKNFNFEILELNFPYFNTPYASVVSDHYKFIKNLLFKKFYPHPFWKSSMNIIAKK